MIKIFYVVVVDRLDWQTIWRSWLWRRRVADRL